jgi:hypothetical protein
MAVEDIHITHCGIAVEDLQISQGGGRHVEWKLPTPG